MLHLWLNDSDAAAEVFFVNEVNFALLPIS